MVPCLSVHPPANELQRLSHVETILLSRKVRGIKAKLGPQEAGRALPVVSRGGRLGGSSLRAERGSTCGRSRWTRRRRAPAEGPGGGDAEPGDLDGGGNSDPRQDPMEHFGGCGRLCCGALSTDVGPG